MRNKPKRLKGLNQKVGGQVQVLLTHLSQGSVSTVLVYASNHLIHFGKQLDRQQIWNTTPILSGQRELFRQALSELSGIDSMVYTKLFWNSKESVTHSPTTNCTFITGIGVRTSNTTWVASRKSYPTPLRRCPQFSGSSMFTPANSPGESGWKEILSKLSKSYFLASFPIPGF